MRLSARTSVRLAAVIAVAASAAAAQTPRPAPAPRPTPAPRVQPPPRIVHDWSELDWETREAVERSLEEAQRAMGQIDLEHIQQVQREAMREAERSLRDAQLDMRLDVQLDLHDMQQELRDAQLDMQLDAVHEQAMVARELAMRDLDVAQLADVATRVDAERVAEQARAAMRDAFAQWPAAAPARFRSTAPAPWVQGDPADSLYRLAREALNRGEYRRAASLFQSIGQRFPKSAYATDAAYYEAFSRYRLRTEPELRQALRVLEARLARKVNSSTSADAEALAARIRGELASWSDAGQARAMAAQLSQQARSGDGCDREEAAVRIEALNALAKIDSTAVLPIVRRVLADRATCAEGLRRQAVFLLGRSSAPDALPLLIDAARNDPSDEVRRSAITWLGRMSDERALTALEQILRESSDARTQNAALGALARSDLPRANQILRGVAERADAPLRLRATAIAELGRDTSAAATTYLRSLYGRLDSARLKEYVVASVARSGGAESAPWLASVARNANEPMRVRRTAIAAYARRDVPVADLARLYEATTERELREELVGVLARRKEPEATDRLLAIARSDDDPRIRRTAIAALARKDDPRTAKLLLEIIDKKP